MNKEYAMNVLEQVERGVLENNSNLAKEAYRYLTILKSTPQDVLNRIFSAKNNTRRN